jgi:hypothetical protein
VTYPFNTTCLSIPRCLTVGVTCLVYPLSLCNTSPSDVAAELTNALTMGIGVGIAVMVLMSIIGACVTYVRRTVIEKPPTMFRETNFKRHPDSFVIARATLPNSGGVYADETTISVPLFLVEDLEAPPPISWWNRVTGRVPALPQYVITNHDTYPGEISV